MTMLMVSEHAKKLDGFNSRSIRTTMADAEALYTDPLN